ncbi:hypothetical protein GCM10011529_03410 [Polymorphobacter glacialis]|uniref:Uncharacterized protein n=1 Tax=Sandarakinorhabdus glacialis TaxID=1614636 RepID=A0A917E3V5_9SPHN|nr:hypothetical protein GCM10011529_03410 [Polymorphobacter glacialis]
MKTGGYDIAEHPDAEHDRGKGADEFGSVGPEIPGQPGYGDGENKGDCERAGGQSRG